VSVPTRRTGSGPADVGSADQLIAEGNRAEEAGRLDEARRLYEKALAAAPGYARAHLNLGIALEATREIRSRATTSASFSTRAGERSKPSRTCAPRSSASPISPTRASSSPPCSKSGATQPGQPPSSSA
jgi:tetratricopeptide (TPR) repeat protein